jgi:hypothetical protein
MSTTTRITIAEYERIIAAGKFAEEMIAGRRFVSTWGIIFGYDSV